MLVNTVATVAGSSFCIAPDGLVWIELSVTSFVWIEPAATSFGWIEPVIPGRTIRIPLSGRKTAAPAGTSLMLPGRTRSELIHTGRSGPEPVITGLGPELDIAGLIPAGSCWMPLAGTGFN